MLNIYSNIKKELESCGLKVAIKNEDESEDNPAIKNEFEEGEEQRGMAWMLSKILECTLQQFKSKLTKVNVNNSNLNDQLKMLSI